MVPIIGVSVTITQHCILIVILIFDSQNTNVIHESEAMLSIVNEADAGVRQ